MIKPIKNDHDLQDAIERISQLFGCPKDTAESDELEVLMVLVEEYENRICPIAAPDPLSVIRERMKDLGLAQKDLIPAIGHRSTVSEILAGKRELTVRMIRNLSVLLRVAPQALFPKESFTRSA
jgi:HTH-type transcriptional regulator/antitoxin HigA